MILIIGLGNPGEEFKKTRHNLGFRVVNQFVKEKKFLKFKFSKKFNSLISEGFLDKKKTALAKPQTFMNESGKAVKKLFTVYCSLLTDLWVIHDDVDLLLGKIKIVKNRGAAGHKGVKSIINELGTKNFVRFRVGIKPQRTENRKQKTEKFVLQKFTKEEEKIIKKVIKKGCLAIKIAITEGIEKAMNRFNK
ncbi:aminoacyl-tRNA hydrolase [Patescibacteria group bacterium]|nr:aminoacyl-tRNA hydrolase [Patescibacteria group bacterium]